jgi:DNA-binding transcriptional LysR family regulator
MYLATEAAKLGQGIALANETVVKGEIKAGTLVEICQSAIKFHRYLLVASQSRWEDPEIKAFRDWIVKLAR